MTTPDTELAALLKRLAREPSDGFAGTTAPEIPNRVLLLARDAIDLAARLYEENRRLVIANEANAMDTNELRARLNSMKTHGSPHGD